MVVRIYLCCFTASAVIDLSISSGLIVGVFI
jgi:hypothetical protein